MIKFKFVFLFIIAFVLAAPAAGTAADPDARTVTITTGDDMKYSVTQIIAKRGEKLKIVLTSKGTMPKIAMAHNVVVLAKGTDADAFVNASAMARTASYVAPSFAKQVIAATKLAGNGETVDVTFTAPNAAGTYDFVCSFPGHYLAGMRGVLLVK